MKYKTAVWIVIICLLSVAGMNDAFARAKKSANASANAGDERWTILDKALKLIPEAKLEASDVAFIENTSQLCQIMARPACEDIPKATAFVYDMGGKPTGPIMINFDGVILQRALASLRNGLGGAPYVYLLAASLAEEKQHLDDGANANLNLVTHDDYEKRGRQAEINVLERFLREGSFEPYRNFFHPEEYIQSIQTQVATLRAAK